MVTNVLLFGGNDLGRQAISILLPMPQTKILGIIDPGFSPNELIYGIPVLGEERIIDTLKLPHNTTALLTIGDNYTRKSVKTKIENLRPDLSFLTLIQPGAFIHPNAIIKQGCIILAGAIIQNDCLIEEHCIIGSGAILEHDTHIGKFCNVGPGVKAGGNLKMDEGSVLGIGTIIKQGIHIGQNSVIGAGSLVLKNIPNYVTAFGNPIHSISPRNPKDSWL